MSPDHRVLRQLAEALLFERIAVWAPQPGRDAADTELPFALGPNHYTCRGVVSAFGRVRITEGSVMRVGSTGPRPIHWSTLVDDLPTDAAVRAEVAQELANTARFCRWNEEHLPALAATRREQTYEELESTLHEGHPYHPCFKARTGFSLDDHRRYGPEAGACFPLCWLAVRRAQYRPQLGNDEASFWRSELGEPTWSELTRALTAAQLDLSGYGLLPVHPWQWSHLVRIPATGRALAARELVDLDVRAGEYWATQSVRTLRPSASGARAHVKLPLKVRISSAERTLDRETVSAAPALSAWLLDVVASDPFLTSQARLVLLAEYAGASYAPSEPSSGLDGSLGVLFRQNVRRHLLPGESAAPFNALFASEADGHPFIDAWLTRYGRTRWLARLLEVCILPVWRLLVRHGIALEAHAQNMILIHRDGWPEGVALRDFHDSLEYVPSFLAEPARIPDLAALDERFRDAPLDRYYAMSSLEELRELFMDTVFVFNLSELSYCFDRHYGFREKQFWHLTHRILRGYDRSEWGNPGRAAALGLHAPAIRTESLFRRRLRAGREHGYHHSIPNALSEFV